MAETGAAGGDAFGGALYGEANTTLAISNCSFSGNWAGGGNGVYQGGGPAGGHGGAIYNTATLTFAEVPQGREFTPVYIFLENSASATGSTFHGSTTLDSRGGAIENFGKLQISPVDCVFSGNNAQIGADIDG